ncbi:MAG: hypothetical protein LAN62_11510, partial [Acidobacteriia bacterium]|nr:hypothetical protein [Terriglobia bacterium]
GAGMGGRGSVYVKRGDFRSDWSLGASGVRTCMGFTFGTSGGGAGALGPRANITIFGSGSGTFNSGAFTKSG